MILRDRWRQWRNRPRRKAAASSPERSKDDLREFVYLDEVSLRSLLSSITGDLREGRSEETADEIQMEAAAALKAGTPLVGEAKLSSRFQTTNSSTIQTSRKATVQSWFRDFRAIPKLRLIEVAKSGHPAVDLDALLSTTDKSLLSESDDLKRGELVEFRVKLSADPVYHLSTMVSEFTGMADDYPDMFATGNALSSLKEAEPINKILGRLLAGLIPIRATAVDYSVVQIGGVEYVAHNDLLVGLDIKREPLLIVGVTEHLAYWKDLRRVLFSEAEFTLLGRVARSGLQPSWTPVKLADLFQDLVPNLVEQINDAGRLPFGSPQSIAANPNDAKLADALNVYATLILVETTKKLKKSDRTQLEQQIAKLSVRSGSASDQRTAFASVSDQLGALSDAEVDPARNLELREQARASSGLSLFPMLVANVVSQTPAPPKKKKTEHLLDVDVIAIYW